MRVHAGADAAGGRKGSGSPVIGSKRGNRKASEEGWEELDWVCQGVTGPRRAIPQTEGE